MDFYPRSPCGERHAHDFTALHNIFISIHALLAESDVGQKRFLQKFAISIHALLAESDTDMTKRLIELRISIHALLAESDALQTGAIDKLDNFYPRSPCGERPKSDTATAFPLSFLSTLSLRRATLDRNDCDRNWPFLSTLSLRRATDSSYGALSGATISIHALLAESDRCQAADMSASRISIHALLAESDPPVREIIQWEGIFLSTLSLRRATQRHWLGNTHQRISIHALLAESDTRTQSASLSL